jgi:uncharacterized protein YkwD
VHSIRQWSLVGSNRQPQPRRRSHGCLGRALVGVALAPLACALALLGVVVVSEAAWGVPLPPIDLNAVEQMAVEVGLLPAPSPTMVALTPTRASTPSVTPFLPVAPTETLTPSATASITPTPSRTATASATASTTAEDTPTASPTLIPSFTRTAFRSATASRTPSRTPTRTRTRTRTPTRTATRTSSAATATASLSPTASDTPDVGAGTVTPAPTATPVPPTATAAACSPTGNSGFESTLVGLINAERQSQGLAAYNSQSQLQAAARLHGTDMACNSFFSHTGSDGSSVRDRIERQGYSWSWAGENIFATSNTSSGAPQSAFDWWMNSAPHRANLLHSNYVDIGIGYVYLAGSPYGGYFTAVFARP